MKTSTPEDADVLIQKIGADIGIHRNPRKGTLKAPDKILEGFEFNEDVLIDEVFPDEFDLENTHRRIESNTQELLEYEKPLLSIGGDHSISYPIIRALKRRNPNLQLVWLDAHLDVKEKVGNHVSHDVVVRELLKYGFSEDEIWFVGITQVDHDEEDFIEDSGFHIYQAEESERFIREFEENEHPVYLSIDIDALTEKEAPGTGYLDGELSMEEVENIIKAVEPDFADLVEVAPPFDEEGKTLDSSRVILEDIVQIFTKK